jgi:peptide/nickel transport system ATP-binding protein
VANVLEVENLKTEFHLRDANVKAVDGVSFSVGEGECVGLVGESGCGKSTTGLSIMKLLPSVGHVTGGSARLSGRDLVPLPEQDMRKLRGNDVAMIFQDPMTSLNPTWTIGRQIAEPVRLHRGASKQEARQRALEVLSLVGMPRPEERLDYYPHQLSGGLRQRVMIAMALACDPKLLIADEPTTALDVTIQAQILDLIDDLRRRLKMAVLLITHDMGVIASRTDRVMVMYAGKIVEGAGTDELFASMRHPYSEALLSSIPRLTHDRSQRLYSIPGLPPDLAHAIVGCRFAPRCRYATDQCRIEEPLLAPGTATPSPGAGAVETSTPSVLGANTSDEHVVACYHPVGVSPAVGGAGGGLADEGFTGAVIAAAGLGDQGNAAAAAGAAAGSTEFGALQGGAARQDDTDAAARTAGNAAGAGTARTGTAPGSGPVGAGGAGTVPAGAAPAPAASGLGAAGSGPGTLGGGAPGAPGAPDGGAPLAAQGQGAPAQRDGGNAPLAGNFTGTASPQSAGQWTPATAQRVSINDRPSTGGGGWWPNGGNGLAGVPVVLEVDHLVKEYTVTSGAIVQRKVGTVKAVSDVSFTVHRGETFGLVGESGCGKTTIGRLVVALERPTAGEVRFNGETVSALRGSALRARRRDLQLMFQDPYASLDPRMRVGSIVSEPLVVQHIGSRPERRNRVSELLGEVGLASKSAALYPHEFSGGQRQRIGLARALALNPRLIVADEPVSALDVSIQAQILNLMRSLQETHGLTYIVISHDLAVIKYLADTIGVMYLGKLVEIGPANEVYAHTAHPYTQGLIDTIPVPDPVLARQRKREAVRGELPSAISPPSGCRYRTRCPLAQEVCAEVEPPMIPFGPGHYAACHFPLQNPVGAPAGVTAGAASART